MCTGFFFTIYEMPLWNAVYLSFFYMKTFFVKLYFYFLTCSVIQSGCYVDRLPWQRVCEPGSVYAPLASWLQITQSTKSAAVKFIFTQNINIWQYFECISYLSFMLMFIWQFGCWQEEQKNCKWRDSSCRCVLATFR